jgi:hypothetical protein
MLMCLSGPGLEVKYRTNKFTSSIKDPTIYCLQETLFIDRNKYWLGMKGSRRFTFPMVLLKQAGVAVLKSDKVDFKVNIGQMR